MEPQTECEATTNESIQNTSKQGSDTPPSEPSINKKPTGSGQRTDPGAAKSSRYFTLLDLCKLTFSLDGEQTLNAETATNEQFAALAEIVATVSNVKVWHLEERRDFCNGLYAWCLAQGYDFPFTIVEEECLE